MDNEYADWSEEELSEFQQLLMEYVLRIERRFKFRRVSSKQVAKMLGVNPSSLSDWMNGHRVPDFENAVILSDPEKLGPKVLEVLGYPYVVELRDIKLRYVAENWGLIDEQTREQIYRTVHGDKPGPAP